MKIFKYETDLHKIDIDHPALPIINDLIHRLIVTVNRRGHSYNPDNDGYIVLVEEGDSDRPLTEIWPDGDRRLIDVPWEGVAMDDTGKYFVAVYLANNQFGLVFVIPDASWLGTDLRGVLEDHLDP